MSVDELAQVKAMIARLRLRAGISTRPPWSRIGARRSTCAPTCARWRPRAAQSYLWRGASGVAGGRRSSYCAISPARWIATRVLLFSARDHE
jgi:hypothetical protein